MQITAFSAISVVPAADDPVVCPGFHAGRRRRRIQQLLQREPCTKSSAPNAYTFTTAWLTIVVTSC